MPYLIKLILDYKPALLNRERRVKELFKSFSDENDDEDESESKETKKLKKIDAREKKINDLFKQLEKAKKDWLKVRDKELPENASEEEKLHYQLVLTFKKKVLKEKRLIMILHIL